MMLTRLRLRRAAIRLATRGWPVTPGAWLRAGRFDCGRLGCPTTACHPALEGWEQAASQDPSRIAAWWRYTPHSLLLPTGARFDALEVPAALGRFAVRSPLWSDRTCGPVIAMPTGRWLFPVRRGGTVSPELVRRLDVILHGRGSWIPAPPTRLAEGPVRWVVPPTRVRWQLPDGPALQGVLATVLPGTPRPETRPGDHPVGAAGIEPATSRPQRAGS